MKNEGVPVNHQSLMDESEIPVATNRNGTRVLSGKWTCPYTGEVFTKPSVRFTDRGGNSRTKVYMDCDHVVALGEAWRWGACHWTSEKRREYANYQGVSYHLVSVKAGANRSKSDHGVAYPWLPEIGKCEYLGARVAIWRNPHWGFKVPQEEVDATLDAFAEHCAPKY